MHSNRLQNTIQALWVFPLLSLIACQTRPEFSNESGRIESRSHAHNDYEHSRPLIDALENGFSSVEADVHLVDGALLVAHDADQVTPSRTLQNLYLDPLQTRFRDYHGKLTPSGTPLILLIDFKTAGEATYRALEPVLENYRKLLTSYHAGVVLPGAVSVIISGNRPTEILAKQTHRLAAIDGRLPDLQRGDLPVSLIPLVSDDWAKHFEWQGENEISPLEQQKLQNLVNVAHRQGRLIRFWGNPDQESYWQLAQQTGVDLINTDDLAGLSNFLRSTGSINE